MMNTEEIQRLKGLAAEVADREGCVVYDLEFVSTAAQGRTLRVYIDKPDGVSLEDCSNVSRGLNLRLDVEDLIEGGAYHLEVSSPGLERPLREPWHFQNVVGQKVWIRSKQSMIEPPGVRKQVTGFLTKADDKHVAVKFEGGSVDIGYDNIDKAHLVFEMAKPENLKPKKKKS